MDQTIRKTKDELKDELDEILGDSEYLKDIIYQLVIQNKKTDEVIAGFKDSVELTKSQKKWFIDITKAISQIKLNLPTVLEVLVKNPVQPNKEVRVNNLDEIEIKSFPNSIKVNNLDEIVLPKEVSVKKPDWYKGNDLAPTIKTLIKAISEKVKVDLKEYQDPKNPISVQLSDGDKFYRALMSVVGGGGGFASIFTDGNKAKDALVDANGHVQVDVLSVPDIIISGSELPSGAATSAKQDTTNTYLSPLSTWVTTAVTLTTLNTAYLLPASEQAARKVIIIYNVSDTACYIGSSTVTTTTGILLPAGGTMNIDSASGIYAICGTSGKILNILEGK